MVVQFLRYLAALSLGGALAAVLSVATMESMSFALDIDLSVTIKLSVAAASLAIGGLVSWHLMARRVFFAALTARSGLRFGVAAIAVCLMGELVFIVLQKLSDLPYPWLALVCFAGMTLSGYLVCRQWVFGRT